MSVNIQEARSLKPALDYSYSEDMQVFLANDWAGDIQFLKAEKDLNGVISIDSVIGGSPSYSYVWNTNPVQTGTNATGLFAGQYTVTVTGASRRCKNAEW